MDNIFQWRIWLAIHPHGLGQIFHLWLVIWKQCRPKSLSSIKGTFSDRKVIFFSFFLFQHKNIYCGYSLEAPWQGASNEYPHYMFCKALLMSTTILCFCGTHNIRVHEQIRKMSICTVWSGFSLYNVQWENVNIPKWAYVYISVLQLYFPPSQYFPRKM